jgi:hypothetical protein
VASFRRHRALVVTAIASAGLVACGAILGLDEPTFVPDGVIAGDGSLPDGVNPDGKPGDGDPCADGKCGARVLAQGYGNVQDIAVDDDSVYFTSFDRWLLVKVKKDGTGLVELLPEGGVQEPTGLTVDATHVFWTAYGAGNPSPERNGIRRMPKGGGAADSYDPCNTGHDVVVDATHVFIVTGQCGGRQRVRRYDKPNPIIAGIEGELDNPLKYSYAEYGYMALDETKVYWANAGEVRSLPKDLQGTSVVVAVVGSGESYQSLRVDDRIYTLTNTRLVATDKPNGSTSVFQILAQNLDAGGGRASMALDKTHVYFTQPKGGIVARAKRTGGPLEVIAKDQKTPNGIAVDATHVFWVNGGDGTVMRASKPP